MGWRKWQRGLVGVVLAGSLASTVVGIATGSPLPRQVTPAILARGNLVEKVAIDAGELQLGAAAGTEGVFQTAIWEPGAESGWHSHGGPFLVIVRSGSATFYDSSCTPRTYTEGQAFVEPVGAPTFIRNEGSEPAEYYSFRLTPPGGVENVEEATPCGFQ